MSPTLKVLSAGFLATVQDGGRLGLQAIGVPPSGALDRIALNAANVLVGNDPAMAAIEFMAGPLRLEVGSKPLLIAVVGGNARLQFTDSSTIPSGQSAVVEPGSTIGISPATTTTSAIVAVSGAIATESSLGSKSTFLRGGFGGMDGRPLRAGDCLLVGPTSNLGSPLKLHYALPYGSGRIRVVLGPQADYFGRDGVDQFLREKYTIGNDSDRMGLRLSGTPVKHTKSFDLVTDGLVTGSIQISGAGLPIVMLADRQTVGGYPKIATVISSDIPRLAQLRIGSIVEFESVDVRTAVQLRRQQDELLRRALSSLEPATQGVEVDLERLMQANLIDGVVSATDSWDSSSASFST